MLIFRVRQGQGQSEPGEYHNRLSLQDKGTTLVLTGVTPHDDRIFTCQGKRRAQEHRIRLRVYRSALSVPCGQRGAWEAVVLHASPSLSLVEAPEEPSIQVNTLGISVNSKEPVEVRSAGVARGWGRRVGRS